MKNFLLALLFCGATTLTFAQNSNQPVQLDQLSEQLQLDGQQKAKLADLLETRDSQVEEAKTLKSSDKEAYVNAMSTVIESTTVEIRNLLSEEQKPLYSAYLREQGKKKGAMYKQLRAEGVSDLDIRVRMVEMD